MRRIVILTVLIAGVALLCLHGCFEAPSEPSHGNPLDPENPSTGSDEPPKPMGLLAVVSDRLVVLIWSVSDTAGVDHYKVYRWEVEEGGDEDYDFLETAVAEEYNDAAVQNGQEYSYKVSAVNESGLEGKLSSPRSATPRVFSVAIEQGRPKTPSRNVTLTLSASVQTELMQVGNASDLSGAQWQPYQTAYSWELEPGDGTKTVYARFRDSEDNESDIVSDEIELDTYAAIESVTEDTEGAVKFVGDVIHFALVAGEAFGEASVDLGVIVPGIELRDDGTGGDATANDGVYERDYTIGHGVEVIEGVVMGYFSDELGNQAEPRLASGTVTVHHPPEAVTMGTPIALTQRRLALSWSESNDSDFENYKLYRSYIPGVDTSTERELIAQITTPGGTDFTDSGLEPDSTYYYAVYVTDGIGLSTISNEVFGTTLANESPDPVELYPPWAPDTTSLEISWSQSDEDDFMQYELLGWEQDPPNPPDSAGKRVIARFDSPGETFYTHESLIDTMIYWYQVAVIDSFGARAVSDSASGSPRPRLE